LVTGKWPAKQLALDAGERRDYHSQPNSSDRLPGMFDKEIVMRPRFYGWLAFSAVCAAAASLLLSGCGKNADGPAANHGGAAETENPAMAVPAPKIGPQSLPALAALMPFKDAVLVEPPDGEQRPPDRTVAGKNVGALFEEIAGQEGTPGLWDKIALTTPDGKLLRYTAHLKTDLGTIAIDLYSESAPNHVRNFIALARAGYYNGLPFHRSLNKQVDGQTLAYLEAGCPLGTGEFGIGSIGYWLKPEISATLTHEEGTIGAVRGEALESAACKFYISLTRAPGMDGAYTIFGKISKGLDIAHTINKRPSIEDEDLSDRPKEPVVIREVTIHAGVEDAAVLAHNP
jgi:peptidyl-prolyl cis-trans isomerase B (cyclophilin B)